MAIGAGARAAPCESTGAKCGAVVLLPGCASRDRAACPAQGTSSSRVTGRSAWPRLRTALGLSPAATAASGGPLAHPARPQTRRRPTRTRRASLTAESNCQHRKRTYRHSMLYRTAGYRSSRAAPHKAAVQMCAAERVKAANASRTTRQDPTAQHIAHRSTARSHYSAATPLPRS